MVPSSQDRVKNSRSSFELLSSMWKRCGYHVRCFLICSWNFMISAIIKHLKMYGYPIPYLEIFEFGNKFSPDPYNWWSTLSKRAEEDNRASLTKTILWNASISRRNCRSYLRSIWRNWIILFLLNPHKKCLWMIWKTSGLTQSALSQLLD